MYADLKGKTALIVGAGKRSGIGRALGLEFASAGARLGLLDQHAEGVEIWAEELRRQGFQVLARACDVADPNSSRNAVEAVGSHFARLDILVNNAGITQREAFAKTEPGVIRKVMDVNFFGSVYCTKAALPSLIQNRGRSS